MPSSFDMMLLFLLALGTMGFVMKLAAMLRREREKARAVPGCALRGTDGAFELLAIGSSQ